MFNRQDSIFPFSSAEDKQIVVFKQIINEYIAQGDDVHYADLRNKDSKFAGIMWPCELYSNNEEMEYFFYRLSRLCKNRLMKIDTSGEVNFNRTFFIISDLSQASSNVMNNISHVKRTLLHTLRKVNVVLIIPDTDDIVSQEYPKLSDLIVEFKRPNSY
ncbi:hypothetical protein ABGV42_00785 [Paenibacillus pabuli]|uniref:hypothetical protein n=1 Tax=Paenibacillus pabuli TaxID=1472 RepID=UPI0032429CAD